MSGVGEIMPFLEYLLYRIVTGNKYPGKIPPKKNPLKNYTHSNPLPPSPRKKSPPPKKKTLLKDITFVQKT